MLKQTFFFILLPLISMFKLDATDSILSSQLEILPFNGFNSWVEFILPSATAYIEESNGFSLLDFSQFSTHGGSYQAQNFTLNNFPATSRLHPGSSICVLPQSAIRTIAFDFFKANLFYNNQIKTSPFEQKSKIKLSFGGGKLGSFLPFAASLVQNLASERGGLLTEERRYLRSGIQTELLFARQINAYSWLSGSALFVDQQRTFNNLSNPTFQFENNQRSIALFIDYAKRTKKSEQQLTATFNSLHNDALGAEWSRLRDETLSLKRNSLLIGWKHQSSNFNLIGSVNFEQENLRPFVRNFSKDLFDPDGEGLLPFEKNGRFSSLVLNLGGSYQLIKQKKLKLTPEIILSEEFFTSKPENHCQNLLFYRQQPLAVAIWERGTNSRLSNFQFQGGGNLSWQPSSSLQLASTLFFQRQAIVISGERSLNFSGFSGTLSSDLILSHSSTLKFLLFQQTHFFKNNFFDFFNPTQPGYQLWKWNDQNKNSIFEPPEKEQLLLAADRPNRHTPESIAPDISAGFQILWAKEFRRNWKLTVDGFYLQYKRLNYLQLDDQKRLVINTETHTAKKPFYAHLGWIVRKNGHKVFFNFSFFAQIAMGYSGLGNGFSAADFQFISIYQALNNDFNNNFGRMESDRAFILKLNGGFFLDRFTTVGFTIRYRDGTPFNFLLFDSSWQNPLPLKNETIKGEDARGVKGGPREDCLWDTNLKISRLIKLRKVELQVEASLYNLFDLGSELSEHAFFPQIRQPLEFQLPRSLRLGISVNFN